MISYKKIRIAQQVLENRLFSLISKSSVDQQGTRLILELNNGLKVIIQYNNHDQYSYSILFSMIELDRCRFDNYDIYWGVSTNPNYFHPHGSIGAKESPMTGDPKKDMALLCEFIEKNMLFEQK